jgi:hypothetical protein
MGVFGALLAAVEQMIELLVSPAIALAALLQVGVVEDEFERMPSCFG